MRHQFLRAAATLRDAILSTAIPATLDYIAAGEGVDGDNQQLEDGVLATMVTFANWRIPLGGACCLMAGWRTLDGALTPMVGPAPLGVNLIEEDYNRLRVQLDGSTKSIDANRNQDDDLQDDHHRAVNLAAEWALGSQRYLLDAGGAGATPTGRLDIRSNAAGTSMVWASNTGWLIQSLSSAQAGIMFVGRDNTTELTVRRNGVTFKPARVSEAPETLPITIGSSATVGGNADAEVNGYSLGPYIDPAVLDTNMNAAVNAITAALA